MTCAAYDELPQATRRSRVRAGTPSSRRRSPPASLPERLVDEAGGGRRLVVDLLGGEVLRVAHVGQGLDGSGRTAGPGRGEGLPAVVPGLLRPEDDHVAVVELPHRVGPDGEPQQVRRRHGEPLGLADEQRAAVAGQDDRVEPADGDPERPAPAQPGGGLLDGPHDVVGRRGGDAAGEEGRMRQELLDEVGDHLGVHLGGEHVTGRDQLGLQLRDVVQGAVVHHRDRARAVDVRVGVDRGGRAVRGPARVPHPRRAALAGRDERGQCRDAAARAVHGERAPVPGIERDPDRVVSPVLHLRETVEQRRQSRLEAAKSNDSTHVTTPQIIESRRERARRGNAGRPVVRTCRCACSGRSRRSFGDERCSVVQAAGLPDHRVSGVGGAASVRRPFVVVRTV